MKLSNESIQMLHHINISYHLPVLSIYISHSIIPYMFSILLIDQVAAFAIDGLISSMVVSGSVFVAGAVPGMVPAGSGSSSGTLLTDTYADMMIHLLTGYASTLHYQGSVNCFFHNSLNGALMLALHIILYRCLLIHFRSSILLQGNS